MSLVGPTHELQLDLSVIDLLLGKNLLSEDWQGHGVSKWAVCSHIIKSTPSFRCVGAADVLVPCRNSAGE